MDIKVYDIIEYMEMLAPRNLAEEWDNTGLLLGSREESISKVLIALDFTDKVLDEAIDKGAELVITHHPILFKPTQRITTDHALGRRIIKAIKNDISLYTAHTNLDYAEGGTNDALFNSLGLINKDSFALSEVDSMYSIGRVGEVEEEISLKDFSTYVGEKLESNVIQYIGDGDKLIKKVAICSGSGAKDKYFKLAVEKGCDVYLTGDIKYHDALDALDLGLCLVDATHYATEILILDYLEKYLEGMFLKDNINIDIYLSKKGSQPFNR